MFSFFVKKGVFFYIFKCERLCDAIIKGSFTFLLQSSSFFGLVGASEVSETTSFPMFFFLFDLTKQKEKKKRPARACQCRI